MVIIKGFENMSRKELLEEKENWKKKQDELVSNKKDDTVCFIALNMINSLLEKTK